MAESKGEGSTKPMFYAHSSQLFTRSNGNPIHFSMRPCGERVEIKGMIEHGGGVISSEISKNCIRLARSGSVVVDSRTVDSRYIYECVKENRLLDLDKFYLVRAESSSSDSDCHQYLTSPRRLNEKKSTAKRKEFTYEEDVIILNFICKNNYHADIGGNLLWKNMEKLQILKDRTWQSMCNRFKKTIRNRLANYNISKGDKFLLEKKTERNKHECWQNRNANNFTRRNRENYELEDSDDKLDNSQLPIIEDDVKTDIKLPKSPSTGVRRLPSKNQMFLEAGPSTEWISPRKRKMAESPTPPTSKPPQKKPKENVTDHASSAPGANKPTSTRKLFQAEKNLENLKVREVYGLTLEFDNADDKVNDARDSGLTKETPVATENSAEKSASNDLNVIQENTDLLNKLRVDITNININDHDHLLSKSLVRIENETSSCDEMDVIDTGNSDSSTPELQLDFVEGETSQTLIKVREKLVDVVYEKSKVSKTAANVPDCPIEKRDNKVQVSKKHSAVLEKPTRIFNSGKRVRIKQMELPEISKKNSEKEIPEFEVPVTVNEVAETEREAVRSETEVSEEIVDNDNQVEVIAQVQFLNMRRKEVKEYMVEEMRKNCGGKISDELFLSLISGTSKLHLVEMIEKDSPRRFKLLDSVPRYFGNPSDNDSFEEFF